MKHFIIGLALLCAGPGLLAQKVVEKHFNLNPNAHVTIDLNIADSITVITWDKAEAYIKTTVDVNDNKDNDAYDLTYDGDGQTQVNVTGKLGKLHHGGCKDSTRNCCCDCCNQVNVTCVAYVPAGTNINLNTINADLTLSGRLGEVRAKTISGFVDLTVYPDTKADVEMKTISGRLYSNVDFPINKGNLRSVGGNVHSNLNGGGGSIDLETISGDIFLRRAG